jgi:hypothetical protein
MEMKKKRLGVVLQWISLIETLSVAVWNNMKQIKLGGLRAARLRSWC